MDGSSEFQQPGFLPSGKCRDVGVCYKNMLKNLTPLFGVNVLKLNIATGYNNSSFYLL